MSKASTTTPVTASERVSDVIARDEELIEVFVRHAPHFAKLRNRAMRQVMARLVTVEQAARMAGVDAAALVADLNSTLGIATASPEAPGARKPAPGAPDAAVHPADARIVELDVREDLRAGREPFSSIMGAVAGLGPGDVLRLRAIFEPVPLFTVLARRGFEHESRKEGEEDWSIWFWRPAAGEGGRPESGEKGAGRGEGTVEVREEEPAIIRLDVRRLEPPEPMLRTLAALETLPPGHTLVQINERVPQFLLPILAERGFAWDIDESRAGAVLVRIWRTT